MRTVLRYPLKPESGNQVVNVHYNSKFLTIRKDSGNLPYICLIVDDTFTEAPRKFLVMKEGEECKGLHYNRQYYGAFESGQSVYHVFDGEKVGV